MGLIEKLLAMIGIGKAKPEPEAKVKTKRRPINTVKNLIDPVLMSMEPGDTATIRDSIGLGKELGHRVGIRARNIFGKESYVVRTSHARGECIVVRLK